jgi:two-component system sensor histidine kinase HydH
LRAEQMALVAQVATGVAHEIRNPLTSIKMLIQANQEDGDDEPLSPEDLQIIEGEIRRMERCLQIFLDYARPPKPDRKHVDLASLTQQTLALVEGRARRQKVALRFEPSPGPFRVEADGGQIHQLLLNLALNALDVMPQGGTLEIVLRKCDDSVELAVVDTGPGITPLMRGRLFQPFATSKETGVGLGLVISRRIAEDHGGSLTEQGPAEGGACFVLRLPLTK